MSDTPELVDLSDQIERIEEPPVHIRPYSRLYRGLLKGQYVAIKVLHPLDGSDVSTLKWKLLQGKIIWSAINHPNILALLGYAEDDNRFQPLGALISPWCQYGSASSFLNTYGDELQQSGRIELWKGVTQGMKYLHESNPPIVHGNLKPANVLIDSQRNPRICDIGLVQLFMDTGHTDLTGTSPPPGTMRYLSPELIKGESPTSVSSDVYALGCIGLEFVFSLKPYYWRQDGDSTLLLRDIELGIPAAERRYDLDAYSDHMWALIKDCLDHDSSSRPSASDVLLSIETGPSGMIVESTNEPDNRSLLQPMETMESPGADSDAPGYCVIPGCHKPISQDPTANVPTKYCGRAHMILGQCSSSSVEPAYIPAYTITQATISAVAENPTIHVKSTFTPSLPDELSVEIGDVVSVLEVFNDGWARCKKVDTGNVGFVPQSCLVALPTPRTN